jgi:phosphoserine phosphatase SerB
MNEPFTLIWISPVVPQKNLEGLYHWLNLHLTDAGLLPLTSFSKIRTRFVAEPKDALRLELDVRSPAGRDSVLRFREHVWMELLGGTYTLDLPYAISLREDSVGAATKKLICFDMDSTLINEEVIDEIARTQGLYEQVAAITEKAMQGGLDFSASLRERVALFRGMPKSAAESIIPSLQVSPGGEKLLGDLRFKGLNTAVVSGGFEFILKHFERSLFLDQVYGNVLETDDDDRFTGVVHEPIVDAAYKQKLVRQLKTNFKATREETIVVGDGANDILMMKEAGISVSFCGKPKLTAAVNTWVLDRNLLWLKELL